MKVVLAVAALGGASQPVSEQSLFDDAALVSGARANGSARDVTDQLTDAIQAAIARGLLLSLRSDDEAIWFVIATDMNRQRSRTGGFEFVNGEQPRLRSSGRPLVFTIYEQNIGLITPIIADRIADALIRYPEHWIEDAIGEAVTYNRRNWRYIERILENWSSEGRNNHETDRRNHEEHHPSGASLRDKYARYLRKR